MAKPKPKKSAASRSGGNRRDKLASFEAARKKEQRRRTVLLLSACVVVAALLLAYPVSLFVQDARLRSAALPDLGVSAAEAGCTPEESNPATGNQEHVEDGTQVDYDRLPPDSGPHLNHWAPFTKKFYSPEDRPVVEELVHNLEHGYTIVWYDPNMPKDQLKDLEYISKTFGGNDFVKDKFIAAPWTGADGQALPEGKVLTMVRWTADPQNPAEASTQKGIRTSCGAVSGEVVENFMKKYPSTAAPEPNGG